MDYFLSEKPPLDKKRAFLHVKSFAFWTFLLGIYFFALLLASHRNSRFNADLDVVKIRKTLKDQDIILSNYIFLIFGFSISLVTSIFIVVNIWKFSNIFIRISIGIGALIHGIIALGILIIFHKKLVGKKSSTIDENLKRTMIRNFLRSIIILGTLYYGISAVGVREVSKIARQSYKVIRKFPMAIFLLMPLPFFHLLTSIFESHSAIELVKIYKEYDFNVINIDALLQIHWGMSLWVFLYFYSFGIMFLSKVYATWYWTEDKKSISQSQTILEAFWTTIRFDLGIIAYSLSPWSLILVIVTTWKNTFNNSSFKKLQICFKIYFSFGYWFANYNNGMSATYNNGLCIGATHNSDFPQSTKFGGFLAFKNALKFAAVFCSMLLVLDIKFYVDLLLVSQCASLFFNTEGIDLKSSTKMLLAALSQIFGVLVTTSTLSTLLYNFESSERHIPIVK